MSKSKIVLLGNINFMLKLKLEDISVNVVIRLLSKIIVYTKATKQYLLTQKIWLKKCLWI